MDRLTADERRLLDEFRQAYEAASAESGEDPPQDLAFVAMLRRLGIASYLQSLLAEEQRGRPVMLLEPTVAAMVTLADRLADTAPASREFARNGETTFGGMRERIASTRRRLSKISEDTTAGHAR